MHHVGTVSVSCNECDTPQETDITWPLPNVRHSTTLMPGSEFLAAILWFSHKPTRSRKQNSGTAAQPAAREKKSSTRERFFPQKRRKKILVCVLLMRQRLRTAVVTFSQVYPDKSECRVLGYSSDVAGNLSLDRAHPLDRIVWTQFFYDVVPTWIVHCVKLLHANTHVHWQRDFAKSTKPRTTTRDKLMFDTKV